MAKAELSAPPDAASAGLMTADELLRLPTGMGERYELVNGELLTMAPTGYEHGDIAAEIAMRLRTYASTHKLGRVLIAEAGFRLRTNPDTVRAPDVSFISQRRLPQTSRPKGFFSGAPDLAVEVISPSEAAVEVQRKITEYFEAGAGLIWLVYPDTRQVVVFRSARESLTLTAEDTLDGGDLLPGFACRVSELFE